MHMGGWEELRNKEIVMKVISLSPFRGKALNTRYKEIYV